MARTTRASAAPLAAFVLHQYDWSETSLIVDLFTREQGRVTVAAKGAKRPYSQLRSVLLPFQRLHVLLGRATRGEEALEVQNLRGAEYAGGGLLRGEALFSGFYLNELLMKLLARHDPHPRLFDHYAAALDALISGAGQDALGHAALRAFELALLREIGLLPELSVVTLTRQLVQADGRYALRPESGIVTAPAGEPALTGADLLRMEAALHAGRLDALQAACGAGLAALRTQLRQLLHYHLGSPQLRTRQVMLDLQRLTEAGVSRPSSESPS